MELKPGKVGLAPWWLCLLWTLVALLAGSTPSCALAFHPATNTAMLICHFQANEERERFPFLDE